METTLLVIGNLIELLIFIGIPLVLVIKNPQTTLSLIKAGFKFLVSAGKFIAPFIMPFLAWVSNQDPFSARSSSSNDDFSTPDVDPVIKYQNGVDGAERY